MFLTFADKDVWVFSFLINLFFFYAWVLFFFLPKDVPPNLARKGNWTEGPLANKVTVYTADVGGVEESW